MLVGCYRALGITCGDLALGDERLCLVSIVY